MSYIEDVKKAMDDNSLSLNDLSKITGIKYASLYKFIHFYGDSESSVAVRLTPFIYGDMKWRLGQYDKEAAQ